MIHSDMDKPACAQCSFSLLCYYTKKHAIAPRQRHLKRKERLNCAQDTFEHLYVIQQGALKAYESDHRGHPMIRGFYFENEVYGYEGIYKGQYPFFAQALTETVLCEIPYQKFLHLLRSEPSLLKQALHLMSQQLTVGSYVRLVAADQRLAAFLLDLSRRLAMNTSQPMFMLPMRYQDIGDYLGLATETVSRILSHFKKDKILSMESRWIKFLRPMALQEIAGEYC